MRIALVLATCLSLLSCASNTKTPVEQPVKQQPVQPQQQTPVAPAPIKSLVECLSDQNAYEVTAMPESLASGLLTRSAFFQDINTHAQLIDYTAKRLAAFTAQYQNWPKGPALEALLQPFEGSAQFSWKEVHLVPFMPLGVVIYDSTSLAFSKLSLTCGASIIPGLELATRLDPYYLEDPQRMKEDLAYISDLNGRLLGFSHARLIAEATSNFRAAEQFYYNGLHPWSEHTSRNADDQFSQAVKLDTFAHLVGNQVFAISPQPNFALALTAPSETAVLTALLWRQAPPAPDAAPDFIFRLKLNPR